MSVTDDDRVEGAVQLAQDAIQRVSQLEDEVDTLRDEVDQLREENAQLRRKNERLRDRDEFLNRVEQATVSDPETRAVILVQSLYNEALANQDTDGRAPKAKLTNQEARKVLGLGTGERWKAWDAMQRAVDLVEEATGGSEPVLEYVKKDRSDKQNSHLVLDLRKGDVSARVAGYDIVRGGAITGD